MGTYRRGSPCSQFHENPKHQYIHYFKKDYLSSFNLNNDEIAMDENIGECSLAAYYMKHIIAYNSANRKIFVENYSGNVQKVLDKFLPY